MLQLYLNILPLIPQSPKHLLPELETIVTRTRNICYQNSKQLLPELETIVTRTQNNCYQNSKLWIPEPQKRFLGS